MRRSDAIVLLVKEHGKENTEEQEKEEEENDDNLSEKMKQLREKVT